MPHQKSNVTPPRPLRKPVLLAGNRLKDLAKQRVQEVLFTTAEDGRDGAPPRPPSGRLHHPGSLCRLTSLDRRPPCHPVGRLGRFRHNDLQHERCLSSVRYRETAVKGLDGLVREHRQHCCWEVRGSSTGLPPTRDSSGTIAAPARHFAVPSGAAAAKHVMGSGRNQHRCPKPAGSHQQSTDWAVDADKVGYDATYKQWQYHHFIRKFTGKMLRPTLSPERRPRLCASLRGRKGCHDLTRVILYGNLQEKCRGPE